MVAQPGHVFWSDDVSLATDELVPRKRIVGHRQVTDAHLLSLAMRRRGRLVTFDRGILQLVPESRDPQDVVELLG
jgi:predicted nucleic acid-binding protein